MNPAAVFLHNDLVTEVLSALPVKSLVRFKSVSKHWKTLITDDSFVKLHLRRSQTRNQCLTLVTSHVKDRCVVPYPISRLLDNPSFTLFNEPHHRLKYNICERIVGSCNGLILFSDKLSDFDSNIECWIRTYWLTVWNPATRKASECFGYIRQFTEYTGQQLFNFAFGCDNSNDTYKVVAFCYLEDEFKTEVRVLSLGDYVWRTVECFMNVILPQDYVYLNETINWLAIHKGKDVRVDQLVIVSFDLRTETYTEMGVPCGFNQVLPKQPEPTLGWLEGCLCFSCYYQEKDFVIWLMKEFGIEDSWTQFLKLNNLNLRIDYNYIDRLPWVPLLLSDDTLILTSHNESQAIIYNWRNNRVIRTNIIASRSSSLDWKDAKVYVESLVPISNKHSAIIHVNVPKSSLADVQEVYNTSRRDQFLMKLRAKFEVVRGALLNRNPVPSLDTCVGELLREEQRLATQGSMSHDVVIFESAMFAYAPQSRAFAIYMTAAITALVSITSTATTTILNHV
ncbi:F-box/kelch-repeat protein At3g23880-like [Vicia villosa]|uniref:F-box/kelch-repeat protein At3g23880-like n=1 Tax=Vicia villosa TaxID=3911 RepID=UPI00273AA4E1|nr:F-box/kelch-repeat protein At3g23880-like [Vicia villosa]